jgi:hypothetical protein
VFFVFFGFFVSFVVKSPHSPAAPSPLYLLLILSKAFRHLAEDFSLPKMNFPPDEWANV